MVRQLSSITLNIIPIIPIFKTISPYGYTAGKQFGDTLLGRVWLTLILTAHC